MENEIRKALPLLYNRLNLLCLLASEIAKTREAMAGNDLGEFERHVDFQRVLSNQIVQLNKEIPRFLTPAEAGAERKIELASSSNGDAGRELEELLRRMEEARLEVRRLNAMQSELLRRCQISVRALLNLIGNPEGTYAAGGDNFALEAPVTCSVARSPDAASETQG